MQKFRRAKEIVFKRYTNKNGEVVELKKLEGISKNKVIIREIFN